MCNDMYNLDNICHQLRISKQNITAMNLDNICHQLSLFSIRKFVFELFISLMTWWWFCTIVCSIHISLISVLLYAYLCTNLRLCFLRLMSFFHFQKIILQKRNTHHKFKYKCRVFFFASGNEKFFSGSACCEAINHFRLYTHWNFLIQSMF